ncbi:ferrochelatase [Gemmatimonas phototrophica]|uniref:ferrochelatase n=1 Tax=Gemmatimonas phototrophica TaxID=1379270 RepID=UPI000AB8BE1B|nr:ferrochelatase [Gemmatimonas phototrophica]
MTPSDVLPFRRPAAPSAGAAPRPAGGTGIVMMNLGGPATLDQVEPFLLRLFADREIIQLPFQDYLGKFIATRRAPKVRKLYDAIGGGSPILKWTEAQGEAMCRRLDEMSPESAPHKFYVAFRYAPPFADDALQAMKADGITRAIAFTQYPQWSCSTTGSSLNDLWRAAERTGLKDAFEWSLIDRWGEHPGFVSSMASAVEDGLDEFPAEERDDVLVMFSAHSLPLSVIDRGDAYPSEISATVSRVVQAIGLRNPHMVTYQSEVGPVRWLGPSTETVIEQLAKRGQKNVLVVPIAFTSDHIETLSELDIEYAELAHKLGMPGFKRAPALNARPEFLDALADIVYEHLQAGAPWSTQYRQKCPGCVNTACRGVPSRVAGTTASANPATVCTPGSASAVELAGRR